MFVAIAATAEEPQASARHPATARRSSAVDQPVDIAGFLVARRESILERAATEVAQRRLPHYEAPMPFIDKPDLDVGAANVDTSYQHHEPSTNRANLSR